METIRKQASKLREQVAKQQQVVFRQLSARFGSSSTINNEADIQCHEQLQKLYKSTRAAKHFQRDLVHGIDGLNYTSSKQVEIVKKLADDCFKYGDENQSAGTSLARASLHFGSSHKMMEKERQNLHKILACQVSGPLREMISGAPLEDSRHLTHQYQRTWQEVEAQAAEVVKRQMKSRDSSGGSAETSVKLQVAESKLSDLRFALSALGVEATAAMTSVDAQQQRVTYQKLLVMVNAERSYHRSVAKILDNLRSEMLWQKQLSDSNPKAPASSSAEQNATEWTDTNSSKSNDLRTVTEKNMFFIAKVLHSFDAQAEGELSLSAGDYLVVRQVAPNGWSEGECNGKAGWFPSAYIEKKEQIPASKFNDACL
ncbi:SH3 domain-containing protein 2-like [Aristolochia californica]|uniref:SH3 domain-containing protein 2-like n=1 Tax=Aristolochia californica TaxID=171875 RepID=UPI0035E0F4F4